MLIRKTLSVVFNLIFIVSATTMICADDAVPQPLAPATPGPLPVKGVANFDGDVFHAMLCESVPGRRFTIFRQSLGLPATPSQSLKQRMLPSPRQPTKPKELRETVNKGLEYLIGRQHQDGGFGQGGGSSANAPYIFGRIVGKDLKDPSDVGNSCMAALALIRGGNTSKNGQYSQQLVNAIEFIETQVESADDKSLYVTQIRDTQLQNKIGHYVDTFLTALVLSEMKGQMGHRESEDRLDAALNKTISKIESNQKADGTFPGNTGYASVLSLGLCSKALSRASQKGVMMKAEMIERDLDQAISRLNPHEAMALSIADVVARKGDAGVELYSLAADSSRIQDSVNSYQVHWRRAFTASRRPNADDKTKDAARRELRVVLKAELANVEATKQLAAKIRDPRITLGSANNGSEEFLSYMFISENLRAQGGKAWDEWHPQICETISEIQNEDGSWSGNHCMTGRTFCTASALLTLMADRAPLPANADGNTEIE